jgi:hypothetical protein
MGQRSATERLSLQIKNMGINANVKSPTIPILFEVFDYQSLFLVELTNANSSKNPHHRWLKALLPRNNLPINLNPLNEFDELSRKQRDNLKL